MNSTGRIVTRRRIKEWVTVYQDKDGNQIVVRGYKRPTKHRIFRVSSRPGRRKFKAIEAKHTTKEIVLVAKKTKNDEAELTEEELEELEEIEDLDDLEDDESDEEVEEDDEDVEDDDDSDDEDEDDDEDSDDEDEDEVDDSDEDEDDESDEDEDEDVEDEDEEDEEEPPAKSKKSKSKKKSSKKGKSRASSDGKVGTQEVATAAGIDGRTLRMVLRKHNIPKDPETKRYEWSSLKHPEVRKIIKLVKERGEGRKVKQESLDNLKKGRTKKSKKKASSSSKSTKSSSKKSKGKKKGGKKKKSS